MSIKHYMSFNCQFGKLGSKPHLILPPSKLPNLILIFNIVWFSRTYIRLCGGDAVRRPRGVGLAPGGAVLRPLVVVHPFVSLGRVKLGAVNSLDVFPEWGRVRVALHAAGGSASVRFLQKKDFLLYSALDITAKCIWEIDCLALDGFYLITVYKRSSKGKKS